MTEPQVKAHGHAARRVLANPGRFAMQTLRAFRANQGMLLAGAVAYYALLSIVPLLILSIIGLSHLVDQADLLATIELYLAWLIPGESPALLKELGNFLANREVIGWVLLGTMFFFSSLAFAVLESAMSVIFVHRFAVRRRHFLVSALLPYGYILLLAIGLLLVTVTAVSLQALGREDIHLFGLDLSLGGFSGILLYLLGFVGEVFLLTSVYLVMPVGRLAWRHALIGGTTAAVLWEITRHLLVWYFSSLSNVSVVYGSLTTAIVVLLSLEIAAALLLFGAQVIAEYERLDRAWPAPSPQPLRIE